MGVHVFGGETENTYVDAAIITKAKESDVSVVVANLATTGNLTYIVEGALGPEDSGEHWDFSVATTLVSQAVASAGLAKVAQVLDCAYDNVRVRVRSTATGTAAIYRVLGEADSTPGVWRDH